MMSTIDRTPFRFRREDVYLSSRASGKIVSCTEEGKGALVATADRASTWETIVTEPQPDGTVAFRSKVSNLYVSVVDGTDRLVPTASRIGSWERFRAFRCDSGDVSAFVLQSCKNGKFVRVNVTGDPAHLAADCDNPDTWEQFTVHPICQNSWKLPEEAVHLKESIEKKLAEIDRIAQEMIPAEGEVHDSWTKAAECARRIGAELRPYLDAFKSQAFFIVTFGMLKAGKSTLVNTLVGNRDVSPVGHGKETTKRSSIIFAADSEHPEGIYFYKPKGNARGGDETKWRKEKCEKLILALGGVGKIEDNFDVEDPEPLSKDRIEKLLTSPPKEGELPPVIRIQPNGDVRFPEETLLKDGVAILDTPGLDGIDVNAENGKDLFWEVLPAQGDFFLLVQSSMSGLNDKCSKQIKKIYGMTETKPGILIVYNEIKSQFWLNDKVQDETLEKDQEAVEAYLRGELREVSRGAETDLVSVNAGAASASLFGNEEQFSDRFAKDPKQLLVDSNIGELTSKLRRMLQTSRMQIKINRLRGLMGDQLSNRDKEIANLVSNLPTTKQEEFAKAEESRKTARKAVSELCGAFHDTGKSNSLVSNIANDVVVEFVRAINEKVIEDCLKTSNPDFTHGFLGYWASSADCQQAIRKWIETVNTDFSQNLVNSIAPGHAILQSHPWSHFSLPNEIKESVSIATQFVKGAEDKDSDDDFRATLLSRIDQQGLLTSISYSTLPKDLVFSHPKFAGKLFHSDDVEDTTWNKHTLAVKARIKHHFIGQGQNSPSAVELRSFVKKRILDAGMHRTDELQHQVEDKAKREKKEEDEWNKKNKHVIDSLERIRSLAKSIHDELNKD